MYKHLEDNGDINILINTEGTTLLICSACGCKWLGDFTPIEEAPRPVRDNLVRVLSFNRDLVRSMNIEIEEL